MPPTPGRPIVKPVYTATLVLLGSCLLAAAVQADLTGRWTCNDGGTYYLRQSGDRVYWFGEAAGSRPAWANVFNGLIAGGRINGEWVDVPKGGAEGSGRLDLVIEDGGSRLRAVARTGGFAGSIWHRRRTQAAATPGQRLMPRGGSDCAGFDSDRLRVQQVNDRWKITTDRHWLFDFGDNRAAAEQSLDVIRHYRMDRICPVGGPDPSMTYLLAKGGVPTGAMAGEDCTAFDPGRTTLIRGKGGWRIVSGRIGVMDVGDRREDAQKALAVIRRHDFSRICRVGRPRPAFIYFRR